jgi:hypothetical protein
MVALLAIRSKNMVGTSLKLTDKNVAWRAQKLHAGQGTSGHDTGSIPSYGTPCDSRSLRVRDGRVGTRGPPQAEFVDGVDHGKLT